jgi:hypothetical protein
MSEYSFSHRSLIASGYHGFSPSQCALFVKQQEHGRLVMVVHSTYDTLKMSHDRSDICVLFNFSPFPLAEMALYSSIFSRNVVSSPLIRSSVFALAMLWHLQYHFMAPMTGEAQDMVCSRATRLHAGFTKVSKPALDESVKESFAELSACLSKDFCSGGSASHISSPCSF